MKEFAEWVARTIQGLVLLCVIGAMFGLLVGVAFNVFMWVVR